VGADAASRGQRLIAVGPRARHLAAAAGAAGLRDVAWFQDPDGAIARLRCILQPDDVVLIKASHATALERVVAALEAA
jgi:UDP-N-acetylmuramyl pentapeptide synthase